jgi:Uma2 family endonuclease
MPVLSSTTRTASTAGAAGADRFAYGWRYVRRTLENGAEVVEQVPLTRADLLHPQEEDVILHSSEHERTCTYLQNVLEARLATDPTAVVLRDVRVAWDVPDVQPLGPDIAVILGVQEQKNWSTFDAAVEGVSPALIIEVTSPETRSLDLIDKVDEYDMAGVPLYVIVDLYRRRGHTRVRLLAYHQSPDGLTPLTPDERGWFWLEPVGIWIGTQADRAVCYDAAGNPLDDYVSVSTARIAAENRAIAAENRALQAETLSQMAENRAMAAEARAVAAEARADRAEAQMSAFEARLQALETQLRRLRGEENPE